ncbi:MAG: glutamate--tRNA ligase [Deltaproteobacteria bacterium]|nr:glutamate--tRNA ligase [Deltaproteobacteria bacterium]
MSGSQRPVRVRIAPSPTGDPHVGTAYIGLFNLAFARKHGGKFILRIEDTDQTRSTRKSEEMIFRSLRWAGIAYDEGPDIGGPFGPYRQSERLPLYQKEAAELVRRGNAYKCTCTPERLEALREEQKKAKQNPGYDGRCRDRDPAEVDKEIAGGAPHVVRLKVPREGVTVVTDLLRGRVEFENKGIDDQVLLKTDGFPTYHLANVVDDHHMQITHVIRGEEWITSTPKHVLLYAGFGWEAPEFCHLPLLRNEDKSKVSKRKNPTSLVFYERCGILPAALRNYLGMMGWTMPDGREVFTLDEMIANFDLGRISLGGPVFDLKKLFWLNGKYLREVVSTEDYLAALRQSQASDEYLKKVITLVKERVDKLEDFFDYGSYFFCGSVRCDVKELVPKGRTADEIAGALAELVERIDKQFAWNKDVLEQMGRTLADEKGWKAKDLFAPIRVAITAKNATPPLFDTMELIGKEVCRRRLREAIALLRAPPAKDPTPPKAAN